MDELGPASTAADVVSFLRSLRSDENRQGMARYGIKTDRALGVSHGVQRKIAKVIGKNHARAFDLWESGIAEARFIAALTADPKQFTASDAHKWASDFDSWDIVDGVSDLFVDCAFWLDLINQFAADEREFVRRTAFAMIAWASIHRKKEPDSTFVELLPLVGAHSSDNRNFVWKAVSWALRSIGKRSQELHAGALELAKNLAASADPASRRIGREAERELNSEKIQASIKRRAEIKANRSKLPTKQQVG